jgi:hypothetical protein
VSDLHQLVFSQTGHFTDSIAVNAAQLHGTGSVGLAFTAAFFDTMLFTQLDALPPLMFALLCNGHKYVKSKDIVLPRSIRIAHLRNNIMET